MGEMLDKAIIIAVNAHRSQLDKGGDDYILHPIRVMSKLKTETERIVGVLHDVIEDTDVTYNDLIDEGFSEEVIEALKNLTRGENEGYFDFINRANLNNIARAVKLADLEDNMDIKRIKDPSDKDFSRIKKYMKAKKILLG